MLNELATRIWAHESFHRDYTAAISQGIVSSQPLSLTTDVSSLSETVIANLLQAAAVFAKSTSMEHREAAYRIATSLLWSNSEEFDRIGDISTIILGRLGNFAVLQTLLKDVGDKALARIPSSLWYEIQAHQGRNTVQIAGRSAVALTGFQRDIWEALKDNDAVCISGPTSSGKSFVVQGYLLARSENARGFTAVYLVPSRALISQVSSDLRALSRKLEIADLDIYTISEPNLDTSKSCIYVLTQERLQLLRANYPREVEPDVVIVDEAHSLAEGDRGTLLESVLQDLAATSNGDSKPQFIFGAPLTKNLEIYGNLLGIDSIKNIQTIESPVAQNLLLVEGEESAVKVDLWVDGRRLSIDRVESDISNFSENEKLAWASSQFGDGQQSLIYAGGQAKAEKIAKKIKEKIRGANTATIDELDELSSLVRNYIHPRYSIVDCLPYGVAYHYGRMPAVLRRNVERLFKEGHIRYLVCTSTLLQGVNLPARNIFMINPTKGRDYKTHENIPLSNHDFWNLVGRAGRLGKEFEGNVYLIDYGSWREKALEGDREAALIPAMQQSLSNSHAEIAEFIENRSLSEGPAQEVEVTAAKLFNDYRQGRLERTFELYGDDLTSSDKERLSVGLRQLDKLVTLPLEITGRHSSISALRQQRMYDYIVRRADRVGLDQLVPPHPHSSNAYNSCLRLIKRFNNYFEGLPKADRSHTFFATLALKWMRGESLRRILDEAIRRAPERNPDTVIRESLTQIENRLRFRFVKYVNCYADLIRFYLSERNRGAEAERIPPFGLFLELGASNKTMINMISLGLTRTAAKVVSDEINDSRLERGECVAALGRFLAENGSVPSLIRYEIEEVIRGTR
ncbi:DEAD/DEAH box helicase [Salinisphaera sp. LB1]|uniref:DEAD/DEAH box helicase n=1 Tax=Salinisphaera sp. LB1 TaxID=2183911 RepID=UPI000D706455|nr:DEAD/DEAH box helicase [Salinisphaera sp. LB1]AWN16618.1 Putative ski2-type helicase [Salinisphaera sp. LB1]